MKIKECTGEGCNYKGSLWQSNPSLCKNCASKAKQQDKPQKKRYEKVYTTAKISPVSDKQAKRLSEYRIVRDKWMAENPFCMVCGKIATDLHHAAGRTGDLLTDTRYFRALCRQHHTYFEINVSEAKRLGISVDRLDK